MRSLPSLYLRIHAWLLFRAQRFHGIGCGGAPEWAAEAHGPPR